MVMCQFAQMNREENGTMSESSAALLPESSAPEDLAGDLCPGCGETLAPTDSWCEVCGFYRTLNQAVELEDEATGASQPFRVPRWFYVLVGVQLVIVAVSFSSRWLTVPQSEARFHWAVTQLTPGGMLLMAAHMLAFVAGIAVLPQSSLLDLILSPVAPWKHTVDQLPKSAWRIIMAVGGVATIVGALFIVDGIPWMALAAGEPIEPGKKPNVVGAMANAFQGMSADGSGDLEESLQAFADQSAVGELFKEEENEDVKDDLTRPWKIDCVVIGYRPLGRISFEWLALAAVRDGHPRFVGTVGKGMSPQQRVELRRQFSLMEQAQPVLPCDLTGEVRWLKPAVTCRVGYRGWTDNGRLDDPVLDQFLEGLDPIKPDSPAAATRRQP